MILLFHTAGGGTQISKMAVLRLTTWELDLVVLIKLEYHKKMVYEHACWSCTGAHLHNFHLKDILKIIKC
jgi:hypothetical protein